MKQQVIVITFCLLPTVVSQVGGKAVAVVYNICPGGAKVYGETLLLPPKHGCLTTSLFLKPG